jgi:hypothetical protein
MEWCTVWVRAPLSSLLRSPRRALVLSRGRQTIRLAEGFFTFAS